MGSSKEKTPFLSRKLMLGTSIGVALIFMGLGVIFWGGFNTAMEVTNNTEFCISCHEMEENVYTEYKDTIHDANRSGVQAGCPDCHVPRPWVHKTIRKIQASNEVLHKVLGTIDTPEKFDAKRLELAKNVWGAMKKTDSRECRNCHQFENMDPAKQRPRARKQHMNAMETGQTCIDCHKGIAHKKVHHLLTDEEVEELAKPISEHKREVPQRWTNFEAEQKRLKEEEKKAKAEARAKAAAERKAKAEAEAKAKAEAEAQQAAALAEQKEKLASVAAAIAAAETAKATPPATAATVDNSAVWADVPETEITIFYPGQSSMEWVLNGRDHGGARPVKAGDRCFNCHAEETADMGAKIVTGEKEGLEPTLIPNKRGSIPVSVKAAYDESHYYLRFSWADAAHTPAPFVEGGKMDANNVMKFALMVASNDVKYAEQAGCWGTCHHDARTMPDAPTDDVLAASEFASRLNASEGISKYLAESRSKLEVRGRGGKPRGGWDKLVDQASIDAALESDQIIDLIRYKAGEKVVEDGYILDQRFMTGGQGAEVDAELADGQWTVTIKRALKSEKAGDVSIDTAEMYNLGFAIHDDYTSARFHHVSLGYTLGFDNDESDIIAVKRTFANAVAPAPAANTAPVAAPEVAAEPKKPKADTVNWGAASETEITIFYPGQSSMEWVLNGRDHGGARPVKAGDRCFDCHAEETAEMGEKIVTGEKKGLEPHLIPNKRGSIPVTVNATYDTSKLYLRFSWADTAHAPAPFVEGGKMDADNAMKFALMLANDTPQYADQAGCWGTCHNDARTMPDTPDAAALAANSQGLDVHAGITKYIADTRTKIEVRGRGGKPRGGWDKLKPAEEVKALLDGQQFMDLIRYKAGDKTTEDGYVLAERTTAQAESDSSFVAELKEGVWTVELTRPLATKQVGDVELSPDNTYNLGFAIHDDYSDARYHHVSLGYKLGFNNDEADINALPQN